MSEHGPYIGRFAPSPTGNLHLGSLLAAIVSYCQAKANQGAWLVRIEDVDETRAIPGAAEAIIKTLADFGMVSDFPIIYQSSPERQDAYQKALQTLKKKDMVYPCVCTRAMIKGHKTYPGFCQDKTLPEQLPHSLRVRVPAQQISYIDALQGEQSQQLQQDCGDFIIKRKDGLFAYQLAVVVDDADQNITEVVRGTDIMDSTARQLFLQQSLAYQHPSYAHFPVIVDEKGAKYSKQNHAKAVDQEDPYEATLKVLQLLQQNIPVLHKKSQKNLLKFAIEHWQPNQFSGKATINY